MTESSRDRNRRDPALMQRMERGASQPRRTAAANDHGWFIREGDIEDHYKVWPLVAMVLFPCIGAILTGFDTGATAWLVKDREIHRLVEMLSTPWRRV